MIPEWLKNTSNSVVILIVALILNFLLDMRGLDRIDQQDVIEEYRTELVRCREVERRCIQTEIELSMKMNRLQMRLMQLDSTINFPLSKPNR